MAAIHIMTSLIMSIKISIPVHRFRCQETDMGHITGQANNHHKSYLFQGI